MSLNPERQKKRPQRGPRRGRLCRNSRLGRTWGGGTTKPSDASERRGFLLHKARSKKTRGPGPGVVDNSRLLEEVASEANLARALLNVVRNKGAPGAEVLALGYESANY
jgi:hypothetical protein